MNELKNRTTELSKIKKETPFRVPENYFDDFSARLQMKLEAEKTTLSGQPGHFVRFFKPALSLAASFALIFVLVYWPLKTFLPSQVTENQPKIDKTEIEYMNMIEGIDESSFYALLNEPSNSIEFSDDDLMSYVSANISDYEIYSETDK